LDLRIGGAADNNIDQKLTVNFCIQFIALFDLFSCFSSLIIIADEIKYVELVKFVKHFIIVN